MVSWRCQKSVWADFIATELALTKDVFRIANRLSSGMTLPLYSRSNRITSGAGMMATADVLLGTIEMMETNMEKPLSIAMLAAHSGFSIRRLERRFVKATGYTPKKFYLLLRLKRGRALVEQTGLSLTQIAISTGFSSGASFARAFVRQYDMTPARLRALGAATTGATDLVKP